MLNKVYKMKKYFWLMLLVFVIVVSCCGCNKDKGLLTATEIFNKCANNVVEIKAETPNVGVSYGTGLVLYSDGTIVTNAHVVTVSVSMQTNKFDNVYVRFQFEEDYRNATVLQYDVNLDLALLRLDNVDDLTLSTIDVGNSSTLNAGDEVYSVGNASNYGIGIYCGIISLPLVHLELDGIAKDVIQCDMTVTSGNSGGALLDLHGNVVGITSFRTKDNDGKIVYGIVYCIPINTVVDWANGVLK